MMVGLIIIGFLGIIVFFVMWCIALLRKNGKAKTWLWSCIAALVVFIIGSVGTPAPKETKTEATTTQTTAPEVKESVPVVKEKTSEKEPSEAEWQASYKQIVLNETSSYIELTVKGTLSVDRHESAIKVLNKYSEKVAPSEKDNASKLAAAVEKDDLATTQKIYISMGGEDFPELHKKRLK
jgi:apolipoprotein N-acyltransferase